MDHNLLRSWLGLPPGAWPPDHYVLLAISPGVVDAAAVETLVLARMDKLRQHQLLHPELVTEGMNRLAQALITLTEPAGKAAYDADLGLPAATAVEPPTLKITPRLIAEPPRTVPLVVAQPVLDDAFPEEAPLGLPASLDATQELAIPTFEVVETNQPRASNLAVSEQEWHEPAPLKSNTVAANIVEAVPVGLQLDVDANSRRWIYARMALLRKAMKSWEKLQPTLANPDNLLDRPGRVLNLLKAIAEVRPHLHALRGVIGDTGAGGGMVVTLLNQPLVLDTLRRLLPDQRQSVAEDWFQAQAALRNEYSRLRQLARTARGNHRGSSLALEFGRWLRDNPEWGLLLLVCLVVFVAMMRGSVSS